jgi:FAD/FMN-containing dehydrogenase/Fe-S oxidoreductase
MLRMASTRALARALRDAGLEDVQADRTTRAAHSSDASLYRQVPRLVAFPRTAADVTAAVQVSLATGIPITARGAGTSVAGNACGPGILLEFRRHMNQVLEVDSHSQTALVQPGVVHAELQASVSAFGLRFGPDPSTHSRCTIGGMIGNDACGSRSLGYGRTSDNVESLTMVTGTGDVLSTSRLQRSTSGFPTGIAELGDLTSANLAVLRTEFGTFKRQISGYALEHLLPENDFDVTRMLVGTEGTLGLLTEARVRLVEEPLQRLLVVLGYPDMPLAADEVPALLEFSPTACEGLDSRIVDVVRCLPGDNRVPELPAGAAWLFVELSGQSPGELLHVARALITASACQGSRIVENQAEAAALWRIREDGAGLAGRAPSGKPAWAGWEDAAVPPTQLGAYLRSFEELLKEHHLTAMPFGHFGDGCVHVRLDFELGSDPGRVDFRDFLVEAAALVGKHGGSLSGEHGDGRARSELLPHMYSPTAMAALARTKHIFDPLGVLNPGIIVDPAPLDADLRAIGVRPVRPALAMSYDDDNGDFSAAVHRCTGVGKCLSVSHGAGVVMCPSYAATKNEKDSTRGRARLLQEMVNGDLVHGWRDPALHEALDLCLSCKGCASDCPTGTDMAAYKAEVLHQSYRGRLRPRAHYTLGRLPQWARFASRMPRTTNFLAGSKLTHALAMWTAGVDGRRSAPKFARTTFRAQHSRTRPSTGTPVVLFVDSFTNHFEPHVAQATYDVLVQAGFAPTLSDERVCCGLTWISTGQLDAARSRLERTVALLAPAARAGLPIIGIEPSCTAALRHDSVDLVNTEDARLVAQSVRTLAEILGESPGWKAPDLSSTQIIAQPHCHHHAVMGWDADATLLEAAGAQVTRLGGCCGLAGNFGVERGHYETSVAVAALQLTPTLEDLPINGVVLADGFSCRTQISDLTAHHAVHLAELLTGSLAPEREAGDPGE